MPLFLTISHWKNRRWCKKGLLNPGVRVAIQPFRRKNTSRPVAKKHRQGLGSVADRRTCHTLPCCSIIGIFWHLSCWDYLKNKNRRSKKLRRFLFDHGKSTSFWECPFFLFAVAQGLRDPSLKTAAPAASIFPWAGSCGQIPPPRPHPHSNPSACDRRR